jgi:hypothetical protein
MMKNRLAKAGLAGLLVAGSAGMQVGCEATPRHGQERAIGLLLGVYGAQNNNPAAEVSGQAILNHSAAEAGRSQQNVNVYVNPSEKSNLSEAEIKMYGDPLFWEMFEGRKEIYGNDAFSQTQKDYWEVKAMIIEKLRERE